MDLYWQLKCEEEDRFYAKLKMEEDEGNPKLSLCGDYCVKDDGRTVQASLDWRWGPRA